MKKNTDNIDKDTKKDEKKRFILWGFIVAILLILIVYIILQSGDNKNDNEQNVENNESTTIIQTPQQSPVERDQNDNTIETTITNTQDYKTPIDMSEYGPGNGSMFSPDTTEDLSTDENSVQYTPEYLPKPQPVDNPIDNRQDLDIFREDIHADNPSEAPTYLLARTYIGNMLNIDINENSGYRQSFDETINKYGTENAKRYGFRPWWISGPDHTQEWNLLASQGGYSIENTFTINDESYIANDTIRYSITAMPRLHGNGGETRMQNINMDIYLKYIDGKWLLDAYQFKNGYPQLR